MRRDHKPKFRWVMPLFIVFIMVFSLFAIMLDNGTGMNTSYNGYKIKKVQDGYEIKAGDTKIQTMYHPEQLESIKSQNLNGMELVGKQVTLSFDPEGTYPEYTDYARFQLAKFLTDIKVTTLSGVTKEGKQNLPVVTCEDATETKIVMIFKQGNQTGITKERNSCYTIESSYPQEIIMVEDRFKLTIAGVMNSTYVKADSNETVSS